MLRFRNKKTDAVGLPPGVLQEDNQKDIKPRSIFLTTYDEATSQSIEIESIADLEKTWGANHNLVSWIDMNGSPSIGDLEQLGASFHIHPMILEDINTADERPTIINDENFIFIIMNALGFNEKSRLATKEQVCVLWNKYQVISIHEEGNSLFDGIHHRINTNIGRIRKTKADYLAYSLIDTIVDRYFEIVERIGDDIEQAEEKILNDPDGETLQEIQNLKKELIFIRKCIWPLRAVVSKLGNGELNFINKSTVYFYKDTYDNIVQILETIEIYRELLSGLLEIYLSSLNNRMNEVMKLLTVISTIFIPLTFIVGVYGMNFHFMPELEWKLGYPIIWAIILVITISMVFFFKRKKWF